MSDATHWKAIQRDWLVNVLWDLMEKWEHESGEMGHFMPNLELDQIARGRTSGCAVELRRVLEGIGVPIKAR